MPANPTITLGNELRQLWRIAWPLLVAQTAQMGTGVVDTVMAGRYNDQDLAAIAIGFNIWLPLYLLILGTLFATATIVAQDFGAGRLQHIRDQLPQALWLSLFISLLLAPICYFSQPVLSLLGLQASTALKTEAYIQMVAFGFPAVGIFMALRYHTQGIGSTTPFAAASITGFLANIPLNYAFIYGHFGLPAMGAEGCGVATALSMWLSAAIIVAYVLTARSLRPYLPPARPVAPDWQQIREILRIGVPVGLTFFLEVGVFSLIALMVATLGDTAMAAHQIAFNIWDMFYIPMLAVGTAMATRIGHAIGAGSELRIRQALLVGSVMAAAISLLTMVILLTVPEKIISIYTESADIRELATRLIRLAAFFILMDAIQIVGSFIMRAYKETRFPFVVTTISYWMIALPAGWWLGFQRADNVSDGAAGFWYAIIIGISVCAALIIWRVRVLLQRPLPTKPETDTAAAEIAGNALS
jgi:MATE family multidrug resistance protein